MRTCKHIKADGEFCGSPALREREYCYFHLTARGRRLRMQKQIMKGEFHSLQLPTLEDANSIQVALMQVMDALVRGQIDTKVSGQLLYGLQIASCRGDGVGRRSPRVEACQTTECKTSRGEVRPQRRNRDKRYGRARSRS